MVRILGFVGLFFVLAVSACGNDDNGPVKPDPATAFPYARPTAATVQMNLDDLDTGKGGSPAGLCHALSALAVTWVNVNVAVRLAIPVAALSACLQQPSVYLGDDTWRWTATGGSPAWTAELTGVKSSESTIDWAMRISGTAEHLDRFLWFSGQCDYQASEGHWVYFDPASAPGAIETVRCDWSLPPTTTGPKEIDFEVIQQGNPQFGDVLQYLVADSVATVRYSDADPLGVTQIQWDLRDGVGSTINAQGDTCCWGGRPLYPDIGCN